MSQSKRDSVIEVVTNTTIGMVGSYVIVYAVMSLVSNIPLSAAINVALCTVWSLARGYWVRRRFERMARS